MLNSKDNFKFSAEGGEGGTNKVVADYGFIMIDKEDEDSSSRRSKKAAELQKILNLSTEKFDQDFLN